MSDMASYVLCEAMSDCGKLYEVDLCFMFFWTWGKDNSLSTSTSCCLAIEACPSDRCPQMSPATATLSGSLILPRLDVLYWNIQCRTNLNKSNLNLNIFRLFPKSKFYHSSILLPHQHEFLCPDTLMPPDPARSSRPKLAKTWKTDLSIFCPRLST